MSASGDPRADWLATPVWDDLKRLESRHRELQKEHDLARRRLDQVTTDEAGELRNAWQRRGFRRILTRTRAELDLCEQAAVAAFFAAERPQYVFHAAGRVGGIHASDSLPADFIRDNLLMAANVIDAAWGCGVRKLVFLGSSCIYPRLAPHKAEVT